MKEAGMKVRVEKSRGEEMEYVPNALTRKSMENIENGENLTVCRDRKDFWDKVLS
jgi:hypothetical protein